VRSGSQSTPCPGWWWQSACRPAHTCCVQNAPGQVPAASLPAVTAGQTRISCMRRASTPDTKDFVQETKLIKQGQQNASSTACVCVSGPDNYNAIYGSWLQQVTPAQTTAVGLSVLTRNANLNLDKHVAKCVEIWARVRRNTPTVFPMITCQECWEFYQAHKAGEQKTARQVHSCIEKKTLWGAFD